MLENKKSVVKQIKEWYDTSSYSKFSEIKISEWKLNIFNRRYFYFLKNGMVEKSDDDFCQSFIKKVFIDKSPVWRQLDENGELIKINFISDQVIDHAAGAYPLSINGAQMLANFINSNLTDEFVNELSEKYDGDKILALGGTTVDELYHTVNRSSGVHSLINVNLDYPDDKIIRDLKEVLKTLRKISERRKKTITEVKLKKLFQDNVMAYLDIWLWCINENIDMNSLKKDIPDIIDPNYGNRYANPEDFIKKTVKPKAEELLHMKSRTLNDEIETLILLNEARIVY